MSKRTERREADRLARKLAYKELRQQRSQTSDIIANATSPFSAEDEIPSESCFLNDDSAAPVLSECAVDEPPIAEAKMMNETEALDPQSDSSISEAQLQANRANAQHSTGPSTVAGKVTSSLNALKHGLTSKTVVLPNEDPDQYQHDLTTHIDIFKPATDEELRFVQTIVDCHWRLDRLGRLETAILLKGHLECANQHKDQPEFHRGRLIHADAYLKYERQIRNLNIQEARLRRTMEKAQAELKNLKATRRQLEMAELQAKRQAEQAAASKPNGFDFSSASNPALTTPIANRHLKKRAA